MEQISFEPSNVLYYDNERFPLGFRRSGDFTVTESEILHRYGRSLRALESGERSPLTEEEGHFIEVCQGQSAPQSDIEKAWLKYRSLLGMKKTISAFGRSRPTCQETVVDLEDDDDSGDDDI